MADDRISKNLHLVYSALKSEGYTDIGDEQDFIKKMQDEQNRLKVYNALKGAGYSDMGSDFKSFSGMIYTAPQPKPKPQAAAPAASPQSSSTTIETNVVQPVVQTPADQQQPTGAAQRAVKNGDGSMLMAPKQEQPSYRFNFTADTYHGVPMLQNDEKGNPKVSGGNFNTVTGKYEGEGSYYTDWMGNKIPVDSDYGKAAVAYQQHVQDVSPIDAELEEAYKERDRINKMLSDRMGEIDKTEDSHPWYIKMLREGGRAYAGDKMGGAGSATDYQLKYNRDQQYRNIMSAARKNRAAIKTLEDKKNGKQNEFWHAFGNAIVNGYTFSQGDSDWGDVNALIDAQKHMPEIERKQKTGEKLTKDEEIAATVIKNHAWDNDVQQRYGDEYGAWARVGESAVGSLELGIDFLTMGAELKATAGSVMKLTEKGATKLLGEAATKGLGKFMTKYTGVTVGSMIAGAEMANTIHINRTMSDVGKRYLGNVTVNEEDGSYQFDGGKGFMQSLYEAEMAASIENGSEVLGEFLPGSGMILKGLEKVGMKKVASGLTRLGGSTWYKNYSKALKAIGFHGVGGEAVEEYAGLLGNALLVGDNKFSDLLDPRTHVDIWLGCAVTGGLLNAPRTVGYAAQGANKGYQAAQYYRYKHKTDKADAAANAVWGDEWVDLRDRIDGTRNEDMTDIATSIYTDADMTPEQKRTALDYIGNLTAMRGYNMGRISMEREDENGRGTSDDERSLNNAFAAGYNATEQEDMEDAKNAYDMHRQLAENSLDEWTLSALDGNENGIDGEPLNPLHILGNMAYSPIVGDAMTDEQRKIAADYLNAKARYDGMLQRVRDDIDSRISASDAAIDQRTNRVGLIQPATMKLDDRRVYVVDGKLVMHDDGSMIDVANSSESILVRDAETGKLEWASPHDFLSVDEEIAPAAEKEAAQAAIREQYAEEQAQKIDGALPFNDGDIYSVMEEDGTQWTAQILADNGDGTVQVAWNGNVNNPQTVSKDFVQELSTNAAMARLAQNEQERAMQEQLDKEDEFQQERPTYNLNDEVTLRGENGEPVRGSITTEENEDGQIEVYTETPINGKKIHMFTRQQIDDMLMEHNGEAVVVPEAPAITAEIDNAGAVQSEPSTVQNDVENVPETTENVPNTDENVQTAEETLAVEPMPMVGEGEDAEPDFGATTPQRAHDYIFNESGLEEADAAAFTKNNVEAANKELEKIKNKKPKMGTSIAKFNKDKAEWEQKVNEAQAKADYWKQVKEARDKVLAQRLAEQQKAAQEAVARRKAESVQENGTVANGSEAEPAGEVTETPAVAEGVETPATEEAPTMSLDNKRAIIQQYLMEMDGATELLNVMSEDEMDLFMNAMDAWEVANEEYGNVMQYFEPDLKSKNKETVEHAKARIKGAHDVADERFAVVEQLHNNLCEKYNISTEEAETPAAEPTGTVASKYDEAKEFYRKNYSLQPLLAQLREQQRFVREGRGDEDVVRAIVDILNEDYGNGEQNDLATAIAAAEAATEANPTDAQKEAGNYKKGHVKVDGFDITIENAKGSTRSGKDAYGKEWSVTMNNTYGYIRGTEGVDGDHIDIYLSDDPSNGNVFVIDQVKADGTFDEHKVMYGFASAEEARDNYLANYSEGWTGLGTISEVTKDEFKKWIESSHRKTKPFADYKNVKVEGAQNEAAEGVVMPAAEKTDEQGNPLNEDGTLKLEKLSSIDEITDEDFSKPTRSVELPALPATVDEAIGANGKPIIIKKNIFERNAERHADLTADDSRNILQSALYNPNLYGQNQKAKRPYNWVVINTKDKEGNNRLVLIELSPEKENAEIVHWHYIDDKGLEKIKRQAEREDGQLLILPSESEEAGALSSPTNDLSSVSKVKNNSASDQENGVKSYKISAFEYTTKRGKKLNMQLVTFESELSKEQMNAAKKLAKDLKGWWSKDDGGFLMRDADSAQKLAESVFGDEEAVANAQPVTLEDMKLVTAEPVAEQEEGFHGGDTVWSKKHGENKHILMAHRMEIDGRSFVQSYSFTDGTGATAQEVEKAHEEERDPRWREGWDGDYTKWKARQDYYDEIERKEQAAADEGRVAYFVAGADSMGQRNGTFHKVWLMPEDVVTEDGQPRYNGRMLWTRDEAYHTEEGFQLGNIYYTGEEFADAFPAPKEEAATEQVTEQAPVEDEGTRAMQLFDTISEGDVFVNDNGLKVEIVKKVEGKRKGISNAALKVRWTQDNGKQERQTGDVKIYNALHFMQYLEANNLAKAEAPAEEQKGSGNKIVTDERYEQLKARMRKKLGQLNVSIIGIDPEMLAIGTEMAVYHIEKGARQFIPYAKAMIEDLGEAIRPYLKSFYNGARDLPEIEANGWTDEMTPYDEVRKIDVANFDQNTTNAMATADMVVKEEQAAQQAEAAKEQIIETRNNNRNEAEQQTETNTQAVADEAAAVASETESVVSSGDAAAINEQVSKIDAAMEKVNKQLALLGYYEADDSDPSKFHESYGYMKTAEKKAVAVALKLSREICKALGMQSIPKRDIHANIAPIGGDVTFRIPLSDGKSLYFNIGLENDHDNLSLSRIMYRVEEKQDGAKYWNSVGHANNYLSNDVTVDDAISDIKRMLRYDAPEFEIKEASASTSAKQSKSTENKPKSKKKALPLQQEQQLDLFGDLFADLNEQASETSNSNNNETTDVQSRTEEEGRGGQQPQQDAQVGRSAGHEAEGTDGRGMGGRSSLNSVSDGERSLGVSGTPQSQQHVEAATETDGKTSGTVAAVKNTNNNHAERGKDYAPKGVDARIEANIKAIELMQQLMLEGKQATPAQMKVLRQYSGWGGLGKAFNENPNGPYSYNPTTKRLKELLGDDAFRLSEDSRDSAFYTPAVVIDTMWDIARAMGFKGGTVLEGSAGIGNIIGAMPTDMSKRSDIHAVEIDETTGNILSLLYPDAKVDIQGFEQTKIANGSVDLAITNVPFVTGLNVRDESGDLDLSKKFRDIHDFCIAKNVRKLREGGIGIFITSNGTLDNSQKLRNWLVGEGGADVVGAFRLHNKTFGGAKVTSDIIVVRKRVNGQKSAHAIDVSTVTAERTGTFVDEKQRGKERTVSMDYNKYFIEHPECMAGEMFFGYEKGDNYRPSSKSLYPVNGKEQETMLAEWVKGFDGMKDEAKRKTAGNGGSGTEKQQDTVYESLGADVKEGSLILDKDGKLCVAQYGKAVPLSVNANKVKGHTKAECFQSYQAIKSALADVLAYQTENEGDEGLKPLLDKLNKAYDGFVKTYGHLHKNTSISFLKNDVDFPNILALEKHSEEGDKKGNKVDKFEKTDIFKQRVVEKDKAPEPKNVKDGIIASIYQYGRIDVPYIAEKVGKSVDDVKQEIVSSGLGFENPNTLQMEVSYEYLSGNVREKLRQAEEANEGGKYAANIEALRKVIPMDIPAHLIDFTLGSSWVEPKLYEDFIKERTDVDAQLTNVGGTWYMKVPYYVQHEKNKAMGVRGEVVKKLILGSELIEAALQNKTITVSETHSVGYGSSKTTETITDKEATQACAAKIDEIRADFKEWARQKLQSDAEMSARIEKAYNEQFNNYVPVDVSMDFVPEYFGGANHKFKMREHQAKAIVRGTMQPLLLAHEVGTGKTFTLISTAMEMRRLGTAKKPMIVVQNATVGQFVASAKELYPNAKVLTLEDKDHTCEGRKNFYAKIKYNDWDMIVVPQSVFERIPDSEERQMRFIQDKIDEKIAILEQMREADQSGRSAIVRQAEKEIEQLKDQLGAIGETATTKRKQRDSKREHITRQNTEVKAREMLDRETDDVENFDDMGIDAILVDEAHEYKHLGFATAMQRGVKGIDPSYSKKSQGVYLKTQAVLEKNNGRNVIFATGTPISNTAAEIWTFMRYLMPADTMKDYGIYYFDDFVRNFGNLTQMLEFTTNGKFKENNRFAGYVNLPELVRIWSSVADTVRTDEAQAVKDNVPDMEGGQAQDIYLPQTRALRSIMKFVKAELERFEKMSGKEKKENSHIPLTMYGVAKAAAVDARLVMADAEDDTNSKTNEAVRQTLKSLKETEKYKGTVALFADNYQNKHSGFNLYDDIREKLIAQGVPANEVVVIRSGMTIKKKQEIFDKVNRGEIRVILGSTFTLGTGVNIQERLHTLIHLDAPNRPMDYTQRNGRIVRQGNLHKVMGIPVRVLRFGVQDSLDVTAYQRLKTKGAIADSIMKGKAMMQNSMEDRAMEEDEDVFGDTVAQLSGSQYAMLKNQAEREVRKYESKRKQWEADQTYVHNAIPRITAQIAESERKAAENNANLAKIEEAFGGSDKPAIKVGKHTFADIAGMSDFFTEQNKKVKETEDEIRKSTGEEQRTRTVDVQIGNATFTIKTTQKKELSYHGGTVDTKVSRSITISCPELGIEDMKGGAYFKNAMENIFNDVVSGSAFREDAAYYSTRAERLKGELELVKSREGQPFQYDKELEDARQKYDEYTDLMKKEMEEKEKKYAEMDSDVEAATGITDAEEADEDSDSEVRFRDSLPNATAEDKDLRFSLRVDPAPNTIKTAYAVFIVKRHEDGSVSLHPKMLADEAVGAPPHTWLNADTGKIKRDKNGNPIENTRGRVSVRDAHGAPLAWRPGKHLAPYPNASQFAVEGDTKGIRDRLPDDVIFFEVEYAADRDYQLEAWEYGVNANGKYEHSQAGLPYIPKDGYYIYRTNANPNIPAMIITGAYRVKRALNDEEAKRLNQEAGGDWFDRKSGEPMTDERLKELGLDEAGLERKAQTFEYDELEPAHDESSVAMGMRGYVRRDLDFSDKNLLKAIAENQRSLKDFPSVDYFAQKYAEEKENDRQREVTTFEDGQVLPVEYDWVNDGYKVEGLNALYTNIDRLLDDFRDKYPEYIATMSKDKESIEVTSWRGVINDTRKPRRRNGQPTKAEQAKAAYIERKTRRAIDAINAEAKRLGLKVEVRTDTEGLKGRRARAKGWYDTKTGKIVIIIPNHTNGGDVMRTLLHEGVAHYGLRELFGEDFDNFLDNVYNNVDEDTRKQIADLAAKNNWDFKVATEEYLASLAEDTNFERAMSQSWWNKIKFLFLEMLRKAGVKLDRTLRDADLRYILWRSYENLATAGEHGILRAARNEVMQERLGVGNYGVEDNTRSVAADAVAEDEMRYRDGDIMDERDQAIVRDRYDRMMQSGMYQFREAMQDSMLSLRRLMEYISQATGEKVKDFENAYMAENALSSKNHAEQDLYGKLLFNPMLDEIHRLAKEDSSRDEVTRYMMAKHGLERNEVMAARAARKAFESEDNKDASGNPIKSEADFLAEYRERDFGGITGLMEEDDLVIAEGLAQQLVSDFENNHDVDELWARTNACTKATLEKTYKAGLLSKSGYDEISGMYEYYIPLRGFDATTSDEVYSYLNNERSGFSTPLKKAEGRKSVADDPIATIANMADSAIVQGNRNMMKQKFLKFAMNHPSDAVSVNRMWLRYDDVNDVWEAVTAKIDENDTPDEVLQKTEQFEETMRQLAEADPDHYKRGKDAANIPYKTLGKSLNEHQVHVKLGGDDYILTINGSPRAAQALNGLTNPDNDTAGAVGAILKAGEYVNRQMSAFYTTRNPEFVLSNFLRDAMYANSTMWVRERPNYAIKFNKNFLKVNPTVIYGLIKKHNAGTLDMNVEIERAFYQFMMNGGETGYTVVKDIDKQKKLIKKYVRMKDATIPIEAAWQFLGDKLDDINRSVENCARFAAFLTSRQMGRSVERSVFDAKEVSVNFNKKGAGSTFMGKTDQTKLGNLGAFTSGLGRSFYVFWNAAVQGTTNFASLHKHHTGKALMLDAGMFLLGAIISGLGGGDDDDYWNLPSYVRRNNICFKIPGTDSFVSIPLGIEQRAIYGLGELFSSVASGRERMSGKEIAKEIAGSLSSMLPLDLMESNGDISLSTVSPSYVKPFVETANNKDWKGMPIYKDTPYNKEDPEWTKASKRTNQYLVDFASWCNEITGGDEVKKGWLNFNPSKIEHVFEGVFGGVSTTANKLVKAGEMIAGKQEFDWSNILMASRVIKSADENAEARRINAEYWKYYGEYKETKRLVDHYEDQESEGIMGTAEKLNFMYNSPEYGRYEIVDDYYSEVKDLSDELNETTNEEERNELETEINELKREMVEAIRAYDDERK